MYLMQLHQISKREEPMAKFWAYSRECSSSAGFFFRNTGIPCWAVAANDLSVLLLPIIMMMTRYVILNLIEGCCSRSSWGSESDEEAVRKLLRQVKQVKNKLAKEGSCHDIIRSCSSRNFRSLSVEKELLDALMSLWFWAWFCYNS